MKKTKILTLFAVTTALSSIAPIVMATSCSSSNIVSISADVGGRSYSAGDTIYKTDIQVYGKCKDGSTKILTDFVVRQELPYEFKETDVDKQIIFDVVASGRGTFVTVIPSTNTVSETDKQYIDYVNEFTKDKDSLVTCHEAVSFVESLGLDITNYKLSGKNQEIMYDVTKHIFVIMAGSKLVYAPQGYALPSNSFYLFKFVDSYSSSCTYSQYFKKNFEFTSKELIICNGIDVGSNKNIERIAYRTEATQAGRVVPIRTYCDILTINTNDTLIHLSEANSIYIEKATKYIEIGQIAYLQAKDVEMEFRTLSTIDHCSIDTFNAISGVTCPENGQDVGAMVYTSIGAVVANLTITYATLQVINATVSTDLTERTTSAFVRLNNDITLKQTWEIPSGVNILLDLNGFILTANGDISAGEFERIIVGNKASLIILDSKRFDAPGNIKLNDCAIAVKGGTAPDDAANLLLNGANIIYTASTADAKSGAIKLCAVNTPTEIHESNFYMYGGKITSVKPTGVDTTAYGVSLDCVGAYFQMIYGEINTTNGTNCIIGHNGYAGTYIDIVGGDLVTDATNACVYHPQDGVLSIADGTLYGGSCVAYKAGDIRVSGGTFIAIGNAATPTTSAGDAFGIDGSVFVLDAVNSCSWNPVLSVSSSTMYSRQKYIITAVGGYIPGAQESWFGGLAEVDFFSGNYMYGGTTSELELELGYLYDTKVFNNTSTNLRMTQNGIWTYVKP